MQASSPKPQSVVQSIAAWCDPDRVEAMLAHLARPGVRPPFWIPLLLLIAATVLVRVTQLDMAVSGLFYDPATGEWPFLFSQPWDWLYHWGVVPGISLGAAAITVYLLGFTVKPLREYRHASLFLALALVLGPGLIVNGLMKPLWGRPRPCQIVEFGGNVAYVPPFGDGYYDDSNSFPSGHASIGFALMAPMFLAFRRHRYLAMAFFVLGMTSGTVMSVTRIVQGRHFLSDVIWSAAIVYFTCWTLGLIMQLYALPQAQSEYESETADDARQVIRLEDQRTRQADEQDQRHKRAA